MAAKRKGARAFFDAQEFIQSLGALLDTLPSESDRQQATSQLETLIQFLVDLKGRLAAIPTEQDTVTARAALDKLALLFTQVKSNPILAAAVGISAAPQRPKPAAIASEEIERAKLAMARFESLPIDQIRTYLNELSTLELKAVASVIGIRSNQRTSHETLAHQIATKITNTRGYRSLRDGTE